MAASFLRLQTFVTRTCLPINSTFSRLPFSTSSTSPLKRVGTHNGTFHCDEALGCYMIKLTSKFHAAQIIRTRNLQVLDTLDAVLDVGGVYDPSSDRFDHHQKGFSEILGDGFGTKLSSAGLVYKHYGVEIIAKTVQLDEGHPDVHRLFLAVYRNFVEAVDAIDNGINQYETDQLPRYVNNTTLSSRISRLNLNWYDEDQSPEKEDEAFQHAMTLAGNEFMDCIHFHAKSWLPARLVVMECLAARKNIDSSGEIMLLTRSCPWKLHIFDLEVEMKVDPVLKYVIYQDDRNNRWRVQAVAVSPDKFESRKPLPFHWRGLTDDHLSDVAGISGCIFVHTSGFIGANKTYEGALAMARASLLA
ncbi:putative metal-dependent protein hydrolase [Helianthus anomalus]